MAHRLNTYQVMKRIHLYASMVIFIFIMMYIVTGFIMVNYDWFPRQDAVTIKNTIPFKLKSNHSEKEIIRQIKKDYSITGRTSDGKTEQDSSIRWRIKRPGLEHQIILNSAKDSITIIRTEQQTLSRISSRLHHLKGYSDGAFYYLWSFLYDVSAISFIVFSLTGFYMWFRLRKKYKWGWVFFFAGIIMPMIVFFYLI